MFPKVTKNECRQVEVPVCTKEPSTIPEQVCQDIPREVSLPCPSTGNHSNITARREISHINALPGVSGRGAAHMCASEEAGVSQRLPGRLPGYLLVQGLRLSPRPLDCEA